MIIDFHTHIFPEKIAQAAMETLSQNSPTPPASDGTYCGLVECLQNAGCDVAINLPILTSPRQFESVTKFAINLNEGFNGRGIYSFGSIHPDSENVKEKLKILVDSGIRGIKIHPEYQNCDFDDDRYYNILKIAKEYDLICVTHTGYDFAYEGKTMRCGADHIVKQVKRLGGYSKLVLAHLGNNMYYGDAFDKIAGLDVYLDTSYVLPTIDKEMFLSIVNKHGKEKILFASDSPWRNIKEQIDLINNYVPDSDVRNMIFFENARKLLNFK